MGGKESIFFCFKNQKRLPHNSLEHKIKYKQCFSKPISLFWKQWEGEESLFLKEKHEAHYMQMHSIFYFDRDSFKCIRDERI